VAKRAETTFSRTTLQVNTTRHHHNLQELWFRTGATKNIPGLRSERVVAPQAKWSHPPELLWRRPLQRSDDVTESRPEKELALVMPQAVRSHRAPNLTTDAHPAATTALTTSGATLDPGMMDRLADDVIRRVERRIRIERERRGL